MGRARTEDGKIGVGIVLSPKFDPEALVTWALSPNSKAGGI